MPDDRWFNETCRVVWDTGTWALCMSLPFKSCIVNRESDSRPVVVTTRLSPWSKTFFCKPTSLTCDSSIPVEELIDIIFLIVRDDVPEGVVTVSVTSYRPALPKTTRGLRILASLTYCG